MTDRIPIVTEYPSAKVRVSPELMAEWTHWRTLDGALVTCSWGEPDAEGYFEPVFTRRPDGWLAQKEAEAAQRALDDVRAKVERLPVKLEYESSWGDEQAMYECVEKAAVLAALQDRGADREDVK